MVLTNSITWESLRPDGHLNAPFLFDSVMVWVAILVLHVATGRLVYGNSSAPIAQAVATNDQDRVRWG